MLYIYIYNMYVYILTYRIYASSFCWAGYLTVFSIFNTCGRIFVGFGSEALSFASQEVTV